MSKKSPKRLINGIQSEGIVSDNPSSSKRIKSEENSDDFSDPLNTYCRKLFVGYYLRKKEAYFNLMYVDIRNNAFLVPEVDAIDFQRIFLTNKWFNHAVRSYFHYLPYHFSITSRGNNKFTLSSPQMFIESLNDLPSLDRTEHNSVVVFQNGELLHAFKARNFLQLRQQGLFKNSAYSLTFYGSDSTQVPIKNDLFSNLTALNFQASDDMSRAFQRILNDSFTSLKELTFYHRAFLTRFNEETALPPNLKYLQASSTLTTILDCNVNSQRHLLKAETEEITVGIELLNRLSRLFSEPIMLNPKIHTLVIHLSAGLRENEVVKLLTNLLPNVATLKTIRFRKRQLKDMYAAWSVNASLRRNSRNYMANCLSAHEDVSIISKALNRTCTSNRLTFPDFPFELQYEIGIFVFGCEKGTRIPFSKHPIDIQFMPETTSTIKMRLLSNRKEVAMHNGLLVEDSLRSRIIDAMMELWPKLKFKEVDVEISKLEAK